MLNFCKNPYNMKFMDRLPTVISCCFCCFLRAGCVLIAVFSFMIGVIFAPNVNQTPGFWDLNSVLANYSGWTEMVAQITLGIASILLCVASGLLLVGSCCNIPVLIEIYQWCAILYSATVVLMFMILAVFCFFVHTNCIVAGGVLCGLIVVISLLTAYFIIVTNSLRMSLKFLSSNDIVV
ncbi:hypothetical protein PYW08_009612 [Mythimna loreyi]|uniref:Uncharacterized protein n=1 Tax=Mythimna loreyi TaxID=667449 RepID=A0ACC2Q7K4_9NEOP|nr:hypothetical protein PYW08_009612 [Mythimna loreyi]